MTRPLVQICLPTHNGEAHLAEALDSLLAQTHEDFEISIVDNASTDATPRIARQYARRDRRIRYVRSDDFVCASESWNRALRSMEPRRSQVMMWASDDDLWSSDYIEALLRPLEADPSVVLAYSAFDRISEDGVVVDATGYRRSFPAGSPFRRVRSLIVGGQYSAIYGLIRTRAITWQPCMVDLSFGADLWFLLQLCAVGRLQMVRGPRFFKRSGGISTQGVDPSALTDARRVWNFGTRERLAIADLKVGPLTRAYITSRLQVSSKVLHPGKRINRLLLPWAWWLRLVSNPRAFGIRARLRRWIARRAARRDSLKLGPGA